MSACVHQLHPLCSLSGEKGRGRGGHGVKNNDRRTPTTRTPWKEGHGNLLGHMEGIRSTELGSASRLPLMCPVPCPPSPTFAASVKRRTTANNPRRVSVRTKREPLRGRPRRRPCIYRCCSPSGAARGRGARTQRLPPRPSCGHQKSCSSTDIDIDVSIPSTGDARSTWRGGTSTGDAETDGAAALSLPASLLPSASLREECTLPFRDEVRHTRDHQDQVTRALT